MSNISILPYAVGASTAGNTGNSLVTYDTVNGVRPLNTTTEYVATFASGGSTTNNVRLTAPLTGIDADTTINALVLDRTTTTPVTYGTVAGAGTLHVASGTILATGSGSGNAISVATLDFGSREGVIVTPPALTISSNLTGSNGLTKAGNGALTLTGNNAGLTGQVTVGAGNITVASIGTNLGGTGDIALTGGTLLFNGTTPETTSRGLALGGDLGMIDAASGSTLTVAGTVSGAGSLVKGTNAGTLILTGSNTYTGGTFVRGGTLSFGSAANLGNTNGIVINPGGILQNTGVVTLSQPVLITAGGGTRGIDTEADLMLNGSVGQNGTPTNALDLTKTGPGTLTLGGVNIFNGQLVVSAGVVRVNGSLAQINTSDVGVTVAANAGLGGSGLIARDVQLATGASLLAGAGPTSVGTLTINGTLTLAGNFAMQLKVGTAAAGDRVSVQGTLAFNGGTATLRLTDLTGNGVFAGPCTFLSTDTGITGTLPTFVLDYTNAPAFANTGLLVVQVGNTFQVVPEPSVNALLAVALGIGAVAFFLRRRRQQVA